jgi:hypothetical protein
VSASDTTAPYWSRDAGDVSASLGSSERAHGSAGSRAAGCRGPAHRRGRAASQSAAPSLEALGNPLVLILIFAAAVSLSLSEWVDAGIILAIVIGSSLPGFYQEYRASAAVEELKKRLALICRVVRDGVETTVQADTLVPGDVHADAPLARRMNVVFLRVGAQRHGEGGCRRDRAAHRVRRDRRAAVRGSPKPASRMGFGILATC